MKTKRTTRTDAAINRLTKRNPDLPRQEFFLTRMLFLASKRLSEFQSAFLHDTGMSLPQYRALSVICGSENGETQPSRLSTVLDSSRTSITRVADDLIKHGWVERIHCSEDRRRQLLRITDKGVKALADAFRIQAVCQTEFWAGFSERERDVLEDLLRRAYLRLEESMPDRESGASPEPRE